MGEGEAAGGARSMRRGRVCENASGVETENSSEEIKARTAMFLMATSPLAARALAVSFGRVSRHRPPVGGEGLCGYFRPKRITMPTATRPLFCVWLKNRVRK